MELNVEQRRLLVHSRHTREWQVNLRQVVGCQPGLGSYIDAERDGGSDFDRFGVHAEWDTVVATGQAKEFVEALGRSGRSVVLDWGFPTEFLYVVAAVKSAGINVWWFDAPRDVARAAFVERGGIDPRCFDNQVVDIEREKDQIRDVFGDHIIETLSASGRLPPETIWNEIGRRAR